MSNKKQIINQDRLQHIGALALDVVEDLLTDTETPIELRLNTAFRIVEMCNSEMMSRDIGEAIVSGIQKNASTIEKNAIKLTHLETFFNKDQGGRL